MIRIASRFNTPLFDESPFMLHMLCRYEESVNRGVASDETRQRTSLLFRLFSSLQRYETRDMTDEWGATQTHHRFSPTSSHHTGVTVPWK